MNVILPANFMAAVLAATVAAAAAWLSFGTIASDMGGGREGVLPLDAMHLAVAGLPGIVVLAVGARDCRGRGVAIAVSPLLLLMIPWLPVRLPAALLIWSGGIESLLWACAAGGVPCAAMHRSA